MVYLIAPALLEAGMVAECREVYVNLAKFALQARGEAAEMMGRAFSKCNYATALQMHAFLRRVAASLQLHVAHAENALLELSLNDALRDPALAIAHLGRFSISPAISALSSNDRCAPYP